MIHITCYLHMIARISSKMVNTEIGVNALVKHVKSVWNCPRVNEWRKFQEEEEKRAHFLIPCSTRWGLWLDSVCYINRNWISLKQFMEKIESTESSAAAKFCQEMEQPEIIKSMGFLSAFEFLVGYLKESEASNFSVLKANVQVGKYPKNYLTWKKLEII